MSIFFFFSSSSSNVTSFFSKDGEIVNCTETLFERGELRERRNRWKHKSQLFPFALITQKSKGVDRRVEEKTPKTLRIKIENQKKKIEDVSWWGKFLSFFSFFPSVTLWIFNDKTSTRHHFLPLVVPSYLVAPTFFLSWQINSVILHSTCVQSLPSFYPDYPPPPNKKLCVLNCASSSSIFLILVVVVWKHCVTHSEVGFSNFSPWCTVAERDWAAHSWSPNYYKKNSATRNHTRWDSLFSFFYLPSISPGFFVVVVEQSKRDRR